MDDIAKKLNVPVKEVKKVVNQYHIENMDELDSFTEKVSSLEELNTMLNETYISEPKYQFERMLNFKYKVNPNDPEFYELIQEAQMKEINEIVKEREIPREVIDAVIQENPEFFQSPSNQNMREVFIRSLENVQSVEEIPSLVKSSSDIVIQSTNNIENYEKFVDELKKKHFDLEELEMEIKEPSVEEVSYEIAKDVPSEMPELPQLEEPVFSSPSFLAPSAVIAAAIAPVAIGIGSAALGLGVNLLANKIRKEYKSMFEEQDKKD